MFSFSGYEKSEFNFREQFSNYPQLYIYNQQILILIKILTKSKRYFEIKELSSNFVVETIQKKNKKKKKWKQLNPRRVTCKASVARERDRHATEASTRDGGGGRREASARHSIFAFRAELVG